MKSQKLTQEQYKMTNITMFIITIFSYLLAIGIEYNNGKNTAAGYETIRLIRGGLYLAILIALVIVVKLKITKKSAMVTMAASYVIVYPLLVFGNGVGTMTLAFPILIGFMVYLNARVIALGCIMTFVTCVSKCVMLTMAGEMVTANIGYTITIVMAFCTFASYVAINLLIKFDKQNREQVEEQLNKQMKIADDVVAIVNDLDLIFQKVTNEMNNIDDAMQTVHMTVSTIADSAEDTARTVGTQADMTSEIQARLEEASQVTNNASSITDGLKEVIKKAKGITDDLHKQSVNVDKNTNNISETMDMLVENVEKVSGITESIFRISSQTNLLALNASIEAARAGEAGKGFAVVADQIRTLAEETKTSTEQITEIINELTYITNNAQKGIEESVESIDVQHQKVEEVTETFGKVETDVHDLTADVETMTGEIQDILNANTNIVNGIDTLSTVSEEVSTESHNSKEIIDSAFVSLNIFEETLAEATEALEKLKEAVKYDRNSSNKN